MAIGKHEILWETEFDADQNILLVVTSPPDRSTYYVYVPKDGDMHRVAKGSSPLKLKEQVRRKFKLG